MNVSRRQHCGLLALLWVTAGTLLCVTAGIHAQAVADPAGSDGCRIIDDKTALGVIVTAEEPSAVVKYAAIELQAHLERATGVRLEIIPEPKAAASPSPFRIFVGPTQASLAAGIGVDDLPPNGFRIRTTADALYLVGKDDRGRADDPVARNHQVHWQGFVLGAPPLDDSVSMGSLFAVYDWLERQTGVKWLWPGESGTVVPKAIVVWSGTVGERRSVPRLIHSQLRINTRFEGESELKNRYLYDTSVWLRRHRFARGVSFQYGHAFSDYWDRFGAAHPEFFAMRPDGVRAPASGRTELVQMCVSNPDLHRQIVSDWRTQRQSRPSLGWINGEENDKSKKEPSCTCEACRAWDPPGSPPLPDQEQRKQAIGDVTDRPLVSLSDRYARFWLALQKEGEKYDPEARVIAYAYADYRQPPVATKLNPRIIVGIVAPPPFPLSDQEIDDFKKLWDGWAATGASLYLRPNVLLTGYCMPYVYANQLGEVYQHAARRGLIADDFDSLLGMWGVQGLNYYMLGRLNVDPAIETSAVFDEYCSCFGAAAPQVRAYFEHWRRVTARCDRAFRERVQGGSASVSKAGDEAFTPDTFVRGRAILEEAAAAAHDERDVLARLEYLGLWLKHADLSMRATAAYHARQESPADENLVDRFRRDKTRIDEFRKAHADVFWNLGVLHRAEVWSGWRKSSEFKK